MVPQVAHGTKRVKRRLIGDWWINNEEMSAWMCMTSTQSDESRRFFLFHSFSMLINFFHALYNNVICGEEVTSNAL